VSVVKHSTEAVSGASKESGLEGNAKKTGNMRGWISQYGAWEDLPSVLGKFTDIYTEQQGVKPHKTPCLKKTALYVHVSST
jgi:hypothetical protein